MCEIPEELKKILENAEWICLATRNHFGDPNAANKFLLKCGKDHVIIVDFIKGKTLDNIKNYPKVAFPILDNENLVDYQLFGEVEIIDKGSIHEELMQILEEKHTRFSTNRIIEGVRRSKRFGNSTLPDIKEAVVFKVNIKDVVVRGPRIKID